MVCLPEPEVIFTHESDLDGLISGLLCQRLARSLFGKDVPLLAYHHQGWRQRNPVEKAAWVCDLAFEPRLDKLDWLIIDHHPLANGPPRNAMLIHDISKSSALLSYELCRQFGLGSAPLDRLVHLSNVADLFLEDDPDFILANDYANLVKTYHFWTLNTLIEGEPERLLDHCLLEVIAAKRRIEDPLGFEWSKHHITELGATVAVVHTLVGNTNLIIHQLFEQGALPYRVLLTLHRRANGLVLVSLRSRQGEAIRVAERLQGGGHPNACGAILPRSVQSIPDAILYLRQILDPTRCQPPSPQSLDDLFDALENPEELP